MIWENICLSLVSAYVLLCNTKIIGFKFLLYHLNSQVLIFFFKCIVSECMIEFQNLKRSSSYYLWTQRQDMQVRKYFTCIKLFFRCLGQHGKIF